MDPLDEDRYHNRNFIRGNWDGRINLCNIQKGEVPTGLFDNLRNVLLEYQEKNSLSLQILDKRNKEVEPFEELPDEISLSQKGTPKVKPLVLRDYQQKIVETIFAEQRGVILAATNSGKCLKLDTPLLTNRGLITFEDILKEIKEDKEVTNPREIKYMGDLRLVNSLGEYEKPESITINGNKKIKKVILEDGRSLEGSYNHPIQVIDENGNFVWKKLENVIVGDTVVSKYNTNKYGTTNVDDDIASFLGLILADGYIGNTEKIEFTNNQKELLDFVERIIGDFPRSKHTTGDKAYHIYTHENEAKSISYYNKGYIQKFHKKYDLCYSVAKDKRIPSVILQGTRDTQLAFLSSLFECEMSISLTDKLSTDFTSASYTMLRQIQLMLLNLGVTSKLSKKTVKRYINNYYGRLTMRAIDSYKLLNMLDFKTKQRNTQKSKFISLYNSKERNPKGRKVPQGKELFYNLYNTFSESNKHEASKHYSIPNSVSVFRARKILNHFKDDGDTFLYNHLVDLCNEDNYYVEVSSIEGIGEEPTFDVVMPDTHTFIADGIVNHNSSAIYSTFSYLLPLVKKSEHLLVIVPNKGVMHQLANNLKGYLGDDTTGIWGDGKKELDNPVVVSTIQSLHSGAKEPDIKLTSEKDKHLKRFATIYYDKIMDKGDKYSNLNLFINSMICEFKYQLKDLEELKDLKNKFTSEVGVKMYFDKQKNDYTKLMMKKGKKQFTKYNETVEFLESVKAVFVDECHLASASSYLNVFSYLKNTRMRVGLTGSLIANDTSSKYIKIKSILGGILADLNNKSMIDRGVSAKPHIRLLSYGANNDIESKVESMIPKKTPKSQIPLLRYQLAYRIGIIENDERNRLVATLAYKLSQHSEDNAVVIIVNSIEHGENIEKFIKKQMYLIALFKALIVQKLGMML